MWTCFLSASILVASATYSKDTKIGILTVILHTKYIDNGLHLDKQTILHTKCIDNGYIYTHVKQK